MKLRTQASSGRAAKGRRAVAVLCAAAAGCAALAGCTPSAHVTAARTGDGVASSRSTTRVASSQMTSRIGNTAASALAPHWSPAAPSAPSVTRSVTSAVRSPSACRPGQLRFAFRAGGQGTGNDLGSIVIVDASSTDCILAGAVTVTPMATPGTPLPSAVGAPQTARASGIPLSADGIVPSLARPAPAGQTWADIFLGGVENKLDTGGGLCPKADTITPAGWRISGVTGTAFVRNLDSTVTPSSGSYPRLFACFFGGKAQFLTISVAGLRSPPKTR